MSARDEGPRSKTTPRIDTEASRLAPTRAERCAAHLVRLLGAELEARGELERSMTLLALGGPEQASERALRAAGLGHVELLPSREWRCDERTLVQDLEDGAFRRMLPRVDVLLLAGVLEGLSDPVAVLRELADRARYLLFTYDAHGPHDAQPCASDGAEHLTEIELRILARSLGAELTCEAREPGPIAYCVRTVEAARKAA